MSLPLRKKKKYRHTVAGALNTEVVGTPVAVFNPVSHDRKELVTVKTEINSPYVRVFDRNGTEVPSQLEKDGDINTVKFIAEFPFTVANKIAEFDLGLGADKGGNTDSYPYFQHCVHQWADLIDSSGDYGISVLNDCKYGMEKPDDSTLRLSLIHTPTGEFGPDSAQNKQDMGKNIFRYGIFAHSGKRDKTAYVAEGFNQPMTAFVCGKHYTV